MTDEEFRRQQFPLPDDLIEEGYRRVLQLPEGLVAWRVDLIDECLHLHDAWLAELKRLGLDPFGQWQLAEDNPAHLQAVLAFAEYNDMRQQAEGEIPALWMPEGWEYPEPEVDISQPANFLAWLEWQRLALWQIQGHDERIQICVDYESEVVPKYQYAKNPDIGRTLRNSWRVLREVYREGFPDMTPAQLTTMEQSVLGSQAQVQTWAQELEQVERLIAWLKLEMRRSRK